MLMSSTDAPVSGSISLIDSLRWYHTLAPESVPQAISQLPFVNSTTRENGGRSFLEPLHNGIGRARTCQDSPLREWPGMTG